MFGKSRVQLEVLLVMHGAPHFRVAPGEMSVGGCGVQLETGIASQIREFGGAGHAADDEPSFEETRFHRADARRPLRRRVERKHRLLVSAWRRVKTSATVGASRVNSRQEVMVPR